MAILLKNQEAAAYLTSQPKIFILDLNMDGGEKPSSWAL